MKLEKIIQNYESVTETGCYLWGSCLTNGYGKVRYAGKMQLAHRVVYEYYFGEIAKGLLVRHKCDVPACINPNHLETGTDKDNRRDCKDRGRLPKGENHSCAKLNLDQVTDIYYSNLPRKTLAELHGMTITTIGRIKTGKTWEHLCLP